MKYFLLLSTLILSLFITGCGDVNVAYINRDKLLDTPQIKAIIDEGHKKLTEAETQMNNDLQAKADAPEDEKQSIQIEGDRKMYGIHQAYNSQIQAKIDSAIQNIIKDKDVDVVIDNSSNSVVFHGGIDITDDVLKSLQ